MREPSPRWFTLPAHRPFLRDLAAGLHRALAPGGPQALSEAVVLVPTRRGARALAESFVAASGGGAMLLPQILALGDLDEGEPPFEPSDLALDLPPAISVSRRRFELAQIVLENKARFLRPPTPASALEVADVLAAFLDSAQIEEVNPAGRLDTLVVADMAKHWATSLDVLDLAVTHWPARLRDLGLIDVAERRARLLRALAQQWTSSPPDRPLVAAGSTGAAPPTRALLRAVAAAPQGAVVLPGLDQDLAEDAWIEVRDDHPQAGMKGLLAEAGVDRSDVRLWPFEEPPEAARAGSARRRLINEALRPAKATADWLTVIEDLGAGRAAGDPSPLAAGLSGLSLVTARDEEEAAAVIALLLRETLAVKDRTAALITPDAALARRVCARLARFGVEADSSAGQPLANQPQGTLAGLAARAGTGELDPSVLLAILKHPLTRLGLPDAVLVPGRRTLERRALRGPRPESWAGLRARVTRRARPGAPASADAALGEGLEDALTVAARLEGVLGELCAVFADPSLTLAKAARGLAAALEGLAETEGGSTGGLWAGPAGEAAAAFLAGTMDDGAVLGGLDPLGAAQVLQDLLAAELVRPERPGQARLRILGVLEARLVSADLLVLAGLEEGVWPRPPPTDPFLSRPMRQALGLPAPERRIGLSAHDFAQAACAQTVCLVCMDRRGGQPAVRSRWLWRLGTLVRGAGLTLPARPEILDWARSLDAPLYPPPADLDPAQRPAPTPPVSARPRRLPVTRIETWVRDPYAVYAREILRLRPLDRPDAPLEAHHRGTAIHRGFQLFAEAHAAGAPDEAGSVFARLVLEALAEAGFGPGALAREATLALRLGQWAAEFERVRRGSMTALLVEAEGAAEIAARGGPFLVTAKADRIEVSHGLAHVIDFKTGLPPTAKQVKAGFSPQLTLTAAILQRGGFAALGPMAPGELLYVRASGRRIPAEVRSCVAKGATASELADAAFEGLRRWVDRYDDPATPYPPWAAPQFLRQRAGDYDHLSRLYEWHVLADDGDAEGLEE